jgi:hypothetical protein
MSKQIRIDIRVSTGKDGFTFAGRTHTVESSVDDELSYQALLSRLDGPLGQELDKAVEHVKRQLRAVCDVPLPVMLDGGR